MKLMPALIALLLLSSNASANIIGSAAQNFNPVTNGLDFVTVQSSNTLKPGLLNIGLFTNYAVNTLPFFDIGSVNSPQKEKLNDFFWQGELNLALGLMKDLDIGLSFPYLINSDVDSRANLGIFENVDGNSGPTEIRARIKYRLYQGVDWGLALIGSINIDQIIDNPFTGTGAGPTYNFELAVDKLFGRVLVGFNLGYRKRNSGTAVTGAGILPYPDQIVASIAASYYLNSWDSNLIAEIYSSNATESIGNLTERDLSSLELLLGIKHDWTDRFSSHLGAAAGLTKGTATPDWRVYAGLNYVVGPLWGGDKPEEIQPEPLTAEGKKVKYVRFILRKIRFIFNTTDFTEETYPVLERLSAYLKTYQSINHMIVEGHTDAIGSSTYNLDLSQRRAEKVREYIMQNSSTKIERIEAIGYGESRPLANNGNFQGRAENRRVELRVFGRKHGQKVKEVIKQE